MSRAECRWWNGAGICGHHRRVKIWPQDQTPVPLRLDKRPLCPISDPPRIISVERTWRGKYGVPPCRAVREEEHMPIVSKCRTWTKALCGPRSWLVFASIMGLSQPILAFESIPIPMTPAQWQTKGDVSFQYDPTKQEILVVNKGYAELKNTNFSNGTIEFDAKFVGSRITGITFRQHDDVADALYFRPSTDCAVSEECIQYMRHGASFVRMGLVWAVSNARAD